MQKIIPGFTVSNPVDRKKGNVTAMAKKNTYDAGSILLQNHMDQTAVSCQMFIYCVIYDLINEMI